MDISGVSPELLVRATLQQRETQTQLEAQVGLLKDTQETQSNAIMSLIASVPTPQPDGSVGNNVDLKV